MSAAARQESQPDRDLLQYALHQVERIPSRLSDEQAVLGILRIRKSLDRAVRNRHDPVILAAKAIRSGLLRSMILASLVTGLGLWRVLDRFHTPLPALDEPITFLVILTLAFLLAWLPLLIALVRARKLRNRAETSAEIDTTPLLTAYDLAVVKKLLKGETPPR